MRLCKYPPEKIPAFSSTSLAVPSVKETQLRRVMYCFGFTQLMFEIYFLFLFPHFPFLFGEIYQAVVTGEEIKEIVFLAEVEKRIFSDFTSIEFLYRLTMWKTL